MGLVEQSQVVASTAVVVSMVTIVTAHFTMRQVFGWLDFISIITVGVIGFVSVIFSLKYGRQLEEQRRELQSLNNIAEAVNHSVELNYVLQSALNKIIELMNAEYGWIYLVENGKLVLNRQAGTTIKFFQGEPNANEEPVLWIKESALLKISAETIARCTTKELQTLGIKLISSIPLERHGVFAGVMVLASGEMKKFEVKKTTLLQAFGSQVGIALHNASLFEQVKQSEQLYADLYERSPDIYYSVDQNGIINRANATTNVVLGYSREELVGKPMLKLYPLSQHEKVRENLRKIFVEGTELRGSEEQIQRRDGSIIDVNVNTTIVYDGDGKPAVARMVLRDITERKKMEAQILQSQKIDSIGNLAGGVAHDFNNILTSILGSASIMRRRIKGDDRYTKYVDLIETASRRGAALTRQLLTFARKDNPYVRPVDVNHVIEETMHLVEATTTKAIQLKKSLSSEVAIVEADEGQIQQAILNLCLNARDAMPNGGNLYVSCRTGKLDQSQALRIPHAEPGDYVVVTVADTGVGIPKNLLGRIFEPFFTTKDEGKGTGLGLAVVYGVVRSHHGYITVESEVNNGTIFTIYLPRMMEFAAKRVKSPGSAAPVGGTEMILIVEDEESVGEVGSDILKDLGYSVDVARNGREAIQMISEKPDRYQLILLDMNMPHMTGKAVFEIVKEQYPRLKVVICSGYSSKMLEDPRLINAVDAYIQKPYEVEDLAASLRSVLDAVTTS